MKTMMRKWVVAAAVLAAFGGPAMARVRDQADVDVTDGDLTGGDPRLVSARAPGSLEIGVPGGIGDRYEVHGYRLDGDTLEVDVSYGGGCETHEFSLTWNGSFAESFPVQVGMALHHDAGDDVCRMLVSETLSFDLSPLRAAYLQGYRTGGTIAVYVMAGWDVATEQADGFGFSFTFEDNGCPASYVLEYCPSSAESPTGDGWTCIRADEAC